MVTSLRTAGDIALNGGVSKRPSVRSSGFAIPTPVLSSTGLTGLNRYGGLIAEDYVSTLNGTRKIETYAKMVSDGKVAALIMAMSLPVKGASWTVEPGGTDAAAKKARDLVEHSLFDLCGDSWESVLHDVLTCLQYGFSLCAENWAIVKGQAALVDLLPMHPRTVVHGNGWIYDDEGQIVEVEQWGLGNNGKWQRLRVPMDRVFHCALNAEFRNPEGRSVLRSAYKHWLIKDAIYRFQAIGLERGAVGVPIALYPEGTPEATQNNLEEFVKNIAVHENGYGVFPDGTKVENFAVQVSTADIMPAIQHHDAQIAASVLAGFLQLGQEGAGGAYALSADQTDLFLQALESIGDFIAARFNRIIIPKIVQYNLDTDQYPRLSCTIAKRSATALAQVMRQLTAGTTPPLTWGEADEDWLRELLQLPPRMAERSRVDDDGDEDPEPLSHPRPYHIRFAEPPAFVEGETIPGTAKLDQEYLREMNRLTDRLQTDLWQMLKLPPAPKERPLQASRRFEAWTLPTEEVDAAIDAFISEWVGDDPSKAGFVGTKSEDALEQSYLRLGHATGASHAAALKAVTVKTDVTRKSPQVVRMLEEAFDRLSANGMERIGHQLDDIKELLVQAQEKGLSPETVAYDLSKKFEGYRRWEWQRLTRTEMSFAANKGMMDEYLAQGWPMYEWVVSDIACPICTAHIGNIYPTGAGPMPPGHPNCLCSSAPI